MPLGWLHPTMAILSSSGAVLTFRICVFAIIPLLVYYFWLWQDKSYASPLSFFSHLSFIFKNFLCYCFMHYVGCLCVFLFTCTGFEKKNYCKKSLHHFFFSFFFLSQPDLYYSFLSFRECLDYVSVEMLFMGSVSLWKWISMYKFICFYSSGTDVQGM